MTIQSKQANSWIMKSFLNTRDVVKEFQEWNMMMQQSKYTTRNIYSALCEETQDTSWKKIMFNNFARPCTIHTLWMVSHNSLATKREIMQVRYA